MSDGANGADPKTALDLLSSSGSSFAAHNSNTKRPTIQGMLPRHDAICTYIIANPTMKLGEVATHFCISQSWLSVCINSPVFQRLYKERRGEEYDVMVLGISEKLNGLAHIVTDQLIDACSRSSKIDDLNKVHGTTLKALGYGSPKTSVNINTQQNNSVTVSGATSSALQESRRVLKQLQGEQNAQRENSSNLSLPSPTPSPLAQDEQS